MPLQSAYGLGIESADGFDALPAGDLTAERVIFELGRVEALPEVDLSAVELRQAQGHNIYIDLKSDVLFFRIGAFLEFRLFPAEKIIRCRALIHLPQALLAYWFIQQIIPLYLLCGGVAEFFHGMAVTLLPGAALDEAETKGCLAFLGDSYAGKSTLLSYLLGRGHALVCDDHLALSRGDYRTVFPATPFYRPYRAGQDLGHVAARFHASPLPLRHIFILEPTFGYEEVEAVELSGLAGIRALLPHVLYNLHNPQLPELFPLVAERFHGLNHLLQQTTIKRLHVPRSMDRLPEVYDFIQKDMVS